MIVFWVGFPAELDNCLSPGGIPVKLPEGVSCAFVSDWLMHCQVTPDLVSARPAADIVVLYAHARLTAHAFRQDYEGVELLKHFRVAPSEKLGDLRKCHVIVVAWESAEEIVRRCPGNVILFSSGVSFLRLPEAIEKLSDHDELRRRALEKADPNDPRLRAAVRADYQPPDSAHEISNWWGASRLIQAINGTGSQMPSAFREKMSLLSTKQALFLDAGSESEKQPPDLPQSSIDALQRLVSRTAPTICYVDDEADQGWEQAFRDLFYGTEESSRFKVVSPAGEKRVRDIPELAQEILGHSPNLLILDLRLGGKDEASAAPKETTGAKLLIEIRSLNKALPILLMTASNKARMLQDVVTLGADAYWMKEGLGEHAPRYAAENPAIELIRLLEALLGDDWQFLLRFQKAQDELLVASQQSQCWWSREKQWEAVYWPHTSVPAPQKTSVLTSPATANPVSILSEIAALYREYLRIDLFAYYGELRSPASKDLWLRGIAIHAARVVEAVHRFDEIETYAEKHNVKNYDENSKLLRMIPRLAGERGDSLGQEIISHRNGAAHYKPGVPFDEGRTRELLGLLATWLMRDPGSYNLGQPRGRANDRDRLSIALARYPGFKHSAFAKLYKAMFEIFTDHPLPDEQSCARLLASADLPPIREREGKRIGFDALLSIVERERGNRAALALQYLQPFAQKDLVQRALQKRWEDGSAPLPLKCHLIWRIGDYTGLTNEFKTQMRSWIFDSFGAWSQSAQEFFSATPEEVLVAIQKKLDESSVYPEHKKWIVICCVPIASEKEAARLLLSALSSKDEFVESTRVAVLKRFFA